MNREEEIQKAIKKGEEPEGMDQLDLKAYKSVLNALSKEPEYQLSADFSDKILKVVQRKQRRSALIDHALLIGGLVLITIMASFALIMLKVEIHLWTALSPYHKIIIMLIILVPVIQWLDSKVLKRQRQ